MKKTFNITVSVKEGASRGVLRGIIQYDTLNEVNIRLSDGSKAFNYDGYTNIIFKVLKADGTAYIDSEGENVIATSPVDGIVTVNLKGQATTAVGLCQSVIEVYSGDGKMTTARFNYEVFEALGGDDGLETAAMDESENYYPVFQNLMEDLSALEARIEEAEAKRVTAEAQRVSLETGYVARAEKAAETAEMWAKASQDVSEGDFATRAELEAVRDGAAPAGYGYGEKLKKIGNANIVASDFEALLEAELQAMQNASVKQIRMQDHPTLDGFSRLGILYKEDSNYATLVSWSYTVETAPAVKQKVAGVWQPWERLYAPMYRGVEYKTAERFLGRPVYNRIVELLAMPENKTATAVSLAAENILIDYSVVVQKKTDDQSGYVSPFNKNAETANKIECWNEGGNIYIQTFAEGWTAYRAYISVKYYKTTDT